MLSLQLVHDPFVLQHTRCQPNEPAALSKLAQLGVLYWQLDADLHETDPKLAAIRKVYNYSYMVRPSVWEGETDYSMLTKLYSEAHSYSFYRRQLPAAVNMHESSRSRPGS